MSDERGAHDPGAEHGATPTGRSAEDVGADTGMWQAFAAGPRETERPKAVGAPFRLLTLVAGLVVFALIVWLLLLR